MAARSFDVYAFDNGRWFLLQSNIASKDAAVKRSKEEYARASTLGITVVSETETRDGDYRSLVVHKEFKNSGVPPLDLNNLPGPGSAAPVVRRPPAAVAARARPEEAAAAGVKEVIGAYTPGQRSGETTAFLSSAVAIVFGAVFGIASFVSLSQMLIGRVPGLAADGLALAGAVVVFGLVYFVIANVGRRLNLMEEAAPASGPPSGVTVVPAAQAIAVQLPRAAAPPVPDDPGFEHAARFMAHFVTEAVTQLDVFDREAMRLKLDDDGARAVRIFIAGAAAAYHQRASLPATFQFPLIHKAMEAVGQDSADAQNTIEDLPSVFEKPLELDVFKRGRDGIIAFLDSGISPGRMLGEALSARAKAEEEARAPKLRPVFLVATRLPQGRADEQGMRQHDDVVRNALRRFAGRELEHFGDGMIGVFDQLRPAIDAALTIHESAASRREVNPGLQLFVRVGMAMGEVLSGSDPDEALREQAKAAAERTEPGSTATTAEVKERGEGMPFAFGVAVVPGLTTESAGPLLYRVTRTGR
ncbi:MAG: hypothetical protein OHK0024_24910 [Thalassobaculales bacterium]